MAVNLSALDLNLLLVLHAVLEERSATRAAERLHVTQSAVSNGLARLRQALGDPLVVRQGRGLTPTPVATDIQPLLAEAISRLERIVDRRGFAPEESTRTFTICLADNHQVYEGPLIAAAFARRLPRAALRIVSPDYLIATNGLATGDVDVAFAPEQSVTAGLRATFLFEERGALVIRHQHPTIRGTMSRELFNGLPHIDVHVALGRPGEGHRAAEAQWRAHGIRRHAAIAVPSFMTAALIAAHTDAVAALPERVARVCCRMLTLKLVPAAFVLPRIKTVMVWHERTDADAGAQYFRQLVIDAVRPPHVRPKPRRA